MSISPRKITTIIEETLLEGGEAVNPIHRVAIVAAIIDNPWHGRGYVEDLGEGLDKVASALGALLAPRVVEALGEPVEAYGKAAIVGTEGEIEHGSALIHTLQFGDHFRNATGASTLLPAVEKRAAAGTTFDIPLKHFTDMKIRSHHQSVEVRISDAPHPSEIVIALAAANQGRPKQRLAAFGTDFDKK